MKFQVVSPASVAEQLSWMDKEGAIYAHLANFGRFQYGTSITAQAYYPVIDTTACEDMTAEAALTHDSKLGHNGFVIVEAGGCSYETKARNIQTMGA